MLVNTITILATGFTALWLVGKKYLIEDQVIGTACYLKPLRWQWRAVLRWIPRAYFALQAAYLLVNLLGTVFVVLQSSGVWSDFAQAGALSSVNKSIVEGGEGLQTSKDVVNVTGSNYITSISNWHLYEATWFSSAVSQIDTSKGDNCSCYHLINEAPNRVLVKGGLAFNRWSWIFWGDMIFRLITFFVLLMVKTLYMSLACMLFLKCRHFVIQVS